MHIVFGVTNFERAQRSEINVKIHPKKIKFCTGDHVRWSLTWSILLLWVTYSTPLTKSFNSSRQAASHEFRSGYYTPRVIRFQAYDDVTVR
jgi:hypothetical protein